MMSDYLARMQQHNSFLDAPMTDRIFIVTMAGHFPRNVKNRLHVIAGTTIDDLAEQLDNIEFEENREREKKAREVRVISRTPDTNNRGTNVFQRQPRNTERPYTRQSGQTASRRSTSPPSQPQATNERSGDNKNATSGRAEGTKTAKKLSTTQTKKVEQPAKNTTTPRGNSLDRRRPESTKSVKSNAEVTKPCQKTPLPSRKPKDVNALDAKEAPKEKPAASSSG